MDLNMLTADFYVILTTSRIGTKYNDLFSQTISTSLSLSPVVAITFRANTRSSQVI